MFDFSIGHQIIGVHVYITEFYLSNYLLKQHFNI